ncbi:MAG: alpha/beta hydrolase [Gemmatimonadota bacterium]|nr:alpha/beta hydrolase [Gemmatimonadota bacterium]
MRFCSLVLVASLCAPFAIVPPVFALQRAGELEIEAVEVTTREGPEITIEAEEGFLWVPEDRDDPDGQLIRLHFYRYPATGPDPGPPIVYLAGGPGGSGTLSSLGDRFGLFQAMREVGDVIAFDQRGVYGSEPYLLCPEEWSYPLGRPTEHDLLIERASEWAAGCADHWEGEGVDLSAYHTLASVADLEDLREALGAERLVLWGISYGTHLGLAMIRNHPDRIERAILAGVEGPDHTVKLPGNWERAIAALDSMVAADPDARAAFGNFRALIDAVVNRVDPPVTVGLGDGRSVKIGRGDVVAFLLGEMSERDDYAGIPAALHGVLENGLQGAAARAAESRTGRRGLAMSIAVDCASGISESRWERIQREVERSWLGEHALSFVPEICEAFPHTDLGPEFRAPVESDVPVLFISGSIDARTPPSNAEEMLEGFPNGVHLVIEGAGHDDDLLLSSPEIEAAMLGFLRGEAPPGRIVLPPLEFDTP